MGPEPSLPIGQGRVFYLALTTTPQTRVIHTALRECRCIGSSDEAEQRHNDLSGKRIVIATATSLDTDYFNPSLPRSRP
jgi:hypothetical protein